jgi:hypothetical protein
MTLYQYLGKHLQQYFSEQRLIATSNMKIKVLAIAPVATKKKSWMNCHDAYVS